MSGQEAGSVSAPKAGDIVPGSFFAHLPKWFTEDDEFYLQIRDVNSDGELDFVGYPTKCDADKVYASYRRPFTLSGEGIDSFSYAKGAERRTFHPGDRVNVSWEGTQWNGRHCCPDEIYQIVTKSSNRTPSIFTVEEESLTAWYGGHSFQRLKFYAENFTQIFLNLDLKDQKSVLSQMTRYLATNDKGALKKAFIVMNEWYKKNYDLNNAKFVDQFQNFPPDVDAQDILPPLTDEQIDFIVKLCDENRDKLLSYASKVLNVQNVRDVIQAVRKGTRGASYKDILKLFTPTSTDKPHRQTVASLLGEPSDSQIDAYILNSSLDLSPRIAAEADSLFGGLLLCAETARGICVPLSLMQPIESPVEK